MNNVRRWPILALVLLVCSAIVPGNRMLSETEAAWTDSEYVSGTVGSGTWPTSGYGRGAASAVLGTLGGLTILPGGTSFPWPGMRGERTQTPAGTSQEQVAGPYSSDGLVSVNGVAVTSAAGGSNPIAGNACGSYSVGSAIAPCVAGAAASATASITSERFRMGLSVAGAGVLTSNVVLVNNTAAAPAVSASVSCNLGNGSSTAVPPTAAGGFVLVGNRQIPIPTTNTSTAPVAFNDGLLNLARYTGVQLHRSVVSGPSTAAAHSLLQLTGTASILSLLGAPLLSISFNIILVSAECGPGSLPTFPPSAAVPASAAARIAEPQDTIPESSTEQTTTTAPTTTSPTTTAPTTTVPTSAEPSTSTAPTTTTTPPAEAAPVAPTPSTTPPPVETAEPPPTTTTELTTTTEPTSTTEPTTTTEPPTLPQPTVFSGPAEGNVDTVTLGDGATCRAPTDADYSGNVELVCSDGTSVVAAGALLTPAGVESATVDGVWQLQLGGRTVTVESANRS